MQREVVEKTLNINEKNIFNEIISLMDILSKIVQLKMLKAF